MSKLKEFDFFYGAVLSTLLNKGICPMLVEGNDDRRIYDLTTDKGDFRLFLKYRSLPNQTKKDGYLSWQFSLSPDDKNELMRFSASSKLLSLGLICGNNDMNKSEYAVLHMDEIQQLIVQEKNSFTISRLKGEKAYRLHIGGGRDQAILIKSARLY